MNMKVGWDDEFMLPYGQWKQVREQLILIRGVLLLQSQRCDVCIVPNRISGGCRVQLRVYVVR